MNDVTLSHQQLLEANDQLSVLHAVQLDEQGRDLRLRFPPLVSLKVGRIQSAIETEVRLVAKEMENLVKQYAVLNADGRQIPVLTPVDPTAKQQECRHLPTDLTPATDPGHDGWSCKVCLVKFTPNPQAIMLTDGEEYHTRRKTLLDAKVTLHVDPLTLDDVESLPSVNPGIMKALAPFVHDGTYRPPAQPKT